MLRTALLAFGIAACLPAEVDAQEDQPRSRVPSLTVSAIAEREVVPDIAVLQLGVSAERKTASAAAEETARASTNVVDAVKAEGVEARDLQTSASVSPVFDEQRTPQGQVVGRTLRGYVARNALTVRLRDTARAGALARTLIDKGANVVEAIHFEVGENERRRDELRVAATKEAVRKAGLYAEAAGVKLGRILSIEPGTADERGNATSLPVRKAAPVGSGIAATVIPVEPGVERIVTSVTITWEIAQP